MKVIKKLTALLMITSLGVLAVWIFPTLAAPTVQATTRYVVVGGTNGLNDCSNPNKPCGSVAHAVQQTDAGDMVLIASGTYTETDAVRIFRDVTIAGDGMTLTTVAVVTKTEQVFQVYGDVTAVIRDLSLGNAESKGVQNLGNLTLARVRVAENRGVMSGGGVHNAANAVLTVSDSIIAKNKSSDSAAGLLNFGQATISNSLFVQNVAAPLSRAGGLHNQGQLTLENVTFALNQAGSATAISNSSSGAITMTNVTIAENQRNGSTATPASAVTNYGSLTTLNTIIANNGPNAQCDGDTPLTSLGYNLDSHSGCNFNHTGDQLNTDPKLASLSTYGALNQISVFALKAGSPAIDTGSPTTCPATDARGLDRPFDGDASGTPRCDIGAFEYRGDQVFLPIVIR